jgi:hypothetical protein
MRFLSQCVTLSAAGLLALGAASTAAAQQQQPRDSSIESGAVTSPDTVSTPSTAPSSIDTSRPSVSSDTGSVTSNPSGVSSPSTVSPDTGMTTDTSKGQVSADTALKAKPGLQTGKSPGDSVNARPDSSR